MLVLAGHHWGRSHERRGVLDAVRRVGGGRAGCRVTVFVTHGDMLESRSDRGLPVRNRVVAILNAYEEATHKFRVEPWFETKSSNVSRKKSLRPDQPLLAAF